MKRTLKQFGMIAIVMALFTTSIYASEELYGASAAEVDSAYTLEEMLAYGLQDERLAQAEYLAIMEAFDITRPFSNIYQAEITHEAALIGLYEAKGIEIPAFDPTSYTIIPDTLTEVYTIGIEAEIANIAMYEAFLLEPLDDDVSAVFEALKAASEKHLDAFIRASEGSGSSQGNVNNKGNRQNGRNGRR